MSYDLMVFDPVAAPRDRKAFMAWYQEVCDWPDDDSCFDVETSSANLQAWYRSMITDWPDIQEMEEDEVSPQVTGYTFSKHAIYVDFRWPVADQAYDTVRKLAVEHKIGFYDVSGDEGDGEIYFPGDQLAPPSQGGWRDVAADFRSGNVDKYIPKPEQPKRSWLDFFWRRK